MNTYNEARLLGLKIIELFEEELGEGDFYAVPIAALEMVKNVILTSSGEQED